MVVEWLQERLCVLLWVLVDSIVHPYAILLEEEPLSSSPLPNNNHERIQ
jgi:hypothetical protein